MSAAPSPDPPASRPANRGMEVEGDTPLLAMLLAALVVSAADLEDRGLTTVGTVLRGLLRQELLALGAAISGTASR